MHSITLDSTRFTSTTERNLDISLNMPAKQIQWKAHEESSLEGVSKFFLLDSRDFSLHHGHDNALNNWTILFI